MKRREVLKSEKWWSFQKQEAQDFHERYDAIVDALDQLTPFHRRILEALFWERKTLKEIGVGLGVTKQTVHYHKGQALKKLEEVLDGTTRD